jgi:hypothetical protein
MGIHLSLFADLVGGAERSEHAGGDKDDVRDTAKAQSLFHVELIDQ